MRGRTHARLIPAFVLVAATLALTGCSKPVGTVSGKVIYQGKPLKGGSVSFVSTEGGQSFAAGLNDDGTYSIPKILGGAYKVCVETDSQKPAKDTAAVAGSSQPVIPKGAKFEPPPGAAIPEGYTPSNPAAAAAAKAAKRYTPIPPHYADAEKTDITYTFTGGDQTFDIELK